MSTLNREEILKKAQSLGLVHDKRTKSTKILEMINELTGENHTAKESVKRKTTGFTKCIIHSNDRDNDEKEMILAILDGSDNERVQIILGEEIELDNKFIGVLKDAVIERHISVIDEDGNPTGKSKLRKEPRYILESV